MFSKLGDTEPLTSIESSLRPLNDDISSGVIDNSSWFLRQAMLMCKSKVLDYGSRTQTQELLMESDAVQLY